MKAIISEKVVEAIKKECTRINSETGGMLVGKEIGNEFIITDFIGPGPNSHHSVSSFSYDPEYELKEYEKIINENDSVELLGWIHKHPGDFDRPSSVDLEFANQVFDNKEWQEWDFDKLLMPIVNLFNDSFKITNYLITKDKRNFEIIPLEIVPESHPKVQALLNKSSRKTANRLDAEIESLKQLGLTTGMEYDEASRLITVTANPGKRISIFHRDIFSYSDFKLEFRLHRTYPVTKPAVFLTIKNRCTPITTESKILMNWSPAHILADIIRFDFPDLVYPIKLFRRKQTWI